MNLRDLPGYTSSRLAFYGMAEQALAGVQFDKSAAEALVTRIDGLMREIEEEVEPKLPPRKLKKSEESLYSLPAKPFKKDGTLSSHMLAFIAKHEGCSWDGEAGVVWLDGKTYPITGKFQLPATLPMKLANQDDLKEWLITEHKWKPSLWNYKKDDRGKPVRDDRGKLIQTSPKMQENKKLCPNLEALQGPLVSQVVLWLSLRNRKSVVEGWLEDPRIAFDGRLSAGAAGFTSTYRMKHTSVVNVPKAEEGVTLGKEMRSLFTARQQPLVLNKHKDVIPTDAVFIGRPSKFGNPFVVGKDGTRGECCDQHSRWLETRPDLIAEIKRELADKPLVCFCAPARCHGHTLRDIASPRRKLVGFDAVALENRVEAHYVYKYPGGPEYAAEILEGDAHYKNAFVFYRKELDKLGMVEGITSKDDPKFKPFRSRSKNAKYALSYGCAPKKLATTLQMPESQGEQLYADFWAANEPLSMLKDNLTQFWETTGGKKWIRSIDGRQVRTRSQHSIVNTLFQSTGAIVMELALIFMEKWLGGWCLDHNGYPCFRYKGEIIYRVVFNHDEAQFDTPESVAEEIGQMGARAITAAGQYLKMNVPLAGSYSVGDNWAETH